MTDPDRQDDGPTGIEAAKVVSDYLALRLPSLDEGDAANIIHILHEAGVRFASFSRDVAEGTPQPWAWTIPGDDQADCNGFLQAQIYCGGEFTMPLYTATPKPAPDDIPPDAEHPINYRKAFAKPAPDAMREALAKKIENAWRWEHRTSVGHFVESLATDEQASIVDALRSAPAPPADGADELLKAVQRCMERRAIRLEQTIRDSIEALERNSTSAPVVECLKAALPSPAVAAEPVAKIRHRGIFIERQLQGKGEYRYICHTGIEKFLPDLYDTQDDAIKAVDAKFANPPVRGDRETIDVSRFMETVRSRWNFEENEFDAIERVLSDPECVAILPIQPVAPRLPQDTLDRLAMLNVSEEEVYEVLKKHLPEDMIDGILQEIKEAGKFGAVQSGAGEQKL